MNLNELLELKNNLKKMIKMKFEKEKMLMVSLPPRECGLATSQMT
jgi:hypothetical protein